MRKHLITLAVGLSGVVVTVIAQSAPPATRFSLTVDSIMRGPALVGYPPSGLRWSGDSKELYFEWRMPNEDEAATWVVSRDGGQPRRLTDDERRNAPSPNGNWDRERRRILGVDRGDIVLIDTVGRTRREITRTTGAESSARWARGGTHVTFVRDNSLFIVPVEGGSAGSLVQLVDASARRSDQPRTDSQRVVREEEQKLLSWVAQEAERRKRREARDRARALPKFELAERQAIVDAALSADESHAYKARDGVDVQARLYTPE
ncbi:MAG: TolB family protein, partial [Vicinamibacterales bacterium]